MEEKKESFGALTQEEKDKVVAWLTKRRPKEAGPIVCAVCGQGRWGVGDHLVAPVIYRKRGLLLGGAAYPLVMLLCENCGHTIFLNGVRMGLVPPKEVTGAVKKEGPNG